MKKFVAALAALVCVLGLSVSSLAYTLLKPSSFSFVRDDGDYYALDTIIQATTFPDEALSIWKRCMSALTGSSSEFCLVIHNASKTLSFCLYQPNSVTLSGSSVVSAVLKQGYTVSCVTIDPVSGSYKSHLASSASNFYVSDSSGACLFWGFGALNNPPSALKYVDWGGKRLQFEDDLGGGEPEEPDTPSSSEPDESIPDTPPPPPYNPTIPTIPEGGEYVPYDTSVWYTFLDRIKTNIGSATNIGFLIFGVSVVWAILTRIVKRFTKAD